MRHGLRLWRIFWPSCQQAVQKGRPARPQPTKAPEAYPQGYVEDAFKVRTKLAVFFNILLEVVLCHAISKRIPRDLEEPAGLGDVAACPLECLFQ